MSGGVLTTRHGATRWGTPVALLLPALVSVTALGVLHAAGAREAVGILSGTAPPGHAADAVYAWLLGLGYVLAWFASVLLAPILALAAVADLLLRRVTEDRGA